MKFIIILSLFLVIACEKEDDIVQPSLPFVACSTKSASSDEVLTGYDNKYQITPRFNKDLSCYMGANTCLLSFSYDKASTGKVSIPVGMDNRMIYPIGGAPECTKDDCHQTAVFSKGTGQGEFKVLSTKQGEYAWSVLNTMAKGQCSEDYSRCGGALPVTWLDFTGSWNGARVVNLKWSTASEQNNKGFFVQFVRPCQSHHTFSSGDFVPSRATNSSVRQDYSYSFPVDEGGTFYFRILQVDLDGTQAFSKVIAVKVGR